MSALRLSILLVVVCLCGCDKPSPVSPTSAVLKEASEHIDSFEKHLAVITNLAATTPAVQVSSTLRAFNAAVGDWSKDYVMLRAKMLAKGVSEVEEQAVVQHYRRVYQHFVNVFGETARILRGRNDAASFDPDLQKAYEILNKLPPP